MLSTFLSKYWHLKLRNLYFTGLQKNINETLKFKFRGITFHKKTLKSYQNFGILTSKVYIQQKKTKTIFKNLAIHSGANNPPDDNKRLPKTLSSTVGK